MSPIQNPTPGLTNALKAAQTGRLTSIKGTVRLTAAPFEELANLRPPSLNVPTTAGIQRLRQAFSQGISQPSPATRGLFELVVKGAVSPAMIDYVIANKQTIADLRRDAAALRPRLENFPTPAWALANAALDQVAEAQTFGDLADTAANRARAAGFIAERLAEHIAPFQRQLRPAIKEALLTGTLMQPTLDELGKKGAKQLVAALRPQLGLLDLLPGTHMPLLRTALGATLQALAHAPGANADQLRAAARAQLRGRALERFNDTHARALALVAETHLPSGPARPRLLALKQLLGLRLGGARAAVAEAARLDARLKKEARGLDGDLASFQRQAQAFLAEVLCGRLVPKARLSAFVGQTSGMVAEAQGKLGALEGRASAEAGLQLGEAARQLGGLHAEVDGAVSELRGAVGGTAGALRDGLVGDDRRTVEGGFSFQGQGEIGGSGRFETRLRDPDGGPGRTEQLIGNALDAIPDIDKSFDVKGSFGGTLSAGASGALDAGMLGSASYEANVSAFARGEAYARGGIKKSGDQLEMYGQAGFKVEAGVAADANFQANLLGGLVQADAQVSAMARAEAHADVAASVTVGRDAQGRIQMHAKAAVDVGASLEASAAGRANLNVAGMQIAAEGQAGVMVGFRANAHAEVGLKDGKFSIGAGFKLAFIVGVNLNFRLSFPVPKFITNFGEAIGKAKTALANGVKQIGETVSNGAKAIGQAVKNVGETVKNVGKAIGNFFSGL